MNYYEVLYILNPNYSKDQIAGVMSEVSDFVEKKKHAKDKNIITNKSIFYY